MKTPGELLPELEESIKQAGSQRKWAINNNFSVQFVNDVVKKRRTITQQIAEALGYDKVTGFVKKRTD